METSSNTLQAGHVLQEVGQSTFPLQLAAADPCPGHNTGSTINVPDDRQVGGGIVLEKGQQRVWQGLGGCRRQAGSCLCSSRRPRHPIGCRPCLPLRVLWVWLDVINAQICLQFDRVLCLSFFRLFCSNSCAADMALDDVIMALATLAFRFGCAVINLGLD